MGLFLVSSLLALVCSCTAESPGSWAFGLRNWNRTISNPRSQLANTGLGAAGLQNRTALPYNQSLGSSPPRRVPLVPLLAHPASAFSTALLPTDFSASQGHPLCTLSKMEVLAHGPRPTAHEPSPLPTCAFLLSPRLVWMGRGQHQSQAVRPTPAWQSTTPSQLVGSSGAARALRSHCCLRKQNRTPTLHGTRDPN